MVVEVLVGLVVLVLVVVQKIQAEQLTQVAVVVDGLMLVPQLEVEEAVEL
jgi:hypothetical protein